MKIKYYLPLIICNVSSIYASSDVESNPNIVFILADDLGYGDISSLNQLGKIITPNIDGMSRDGVTFMDAHSSSAVSTPTRYGILTGRYNWRSRLKHGVLLPYDEPLIDENRTTMASMLRSKGYNTACIGKWHLGMSFATTDGEKIIDTNEKCNLDFSKEIKGGPCDVGFDYYFGVDVPNYPPYCFIENRKTLGIPDTFFIAHKKMGLSAGHGLAEWKFENILPTMVDKAVGYINEYSQKKEPFFLYFPLTSPHVPIVPTEDFKGKSGLNLYADYVMQTDDVVGKIIKALKENGIYENTIVVFTSDNGCSPTAEFKVLEKKGHDPNYIFRGMKTDLFEGGHHIPCIVTWPNKINQHKVHQTICLTDFMATFASIVDYVISDNEAEDSYNISPLLLEENESSIIREATVHHSIDGSFAIRQGEWKLLLTDRSGGWTKFKPETDCLYQLYNLIEDPEEKRNLYNIHNDIANRLKLLLLSYINKGRSTPGKSQKNDVVNEWRQLDSILD